MSLGGNDNSGTIATESPHSPGLSPAEILARAEGYHDGMLPLVESWSECPACLTDTPRRALHVTRNRKSPLISGPYYAVLGCERCGLAYVSPRPTTSAMHRFYEDEDRDGWTVRHDEAGAAAKRDKKSQLASRALMPILGPRRQGRALDIGCGAGDILNVLKHSGWDTVGIEPHAALAAIAAQHHRLISEVPREPVFDLVVVHHVLEHLLSPGSLLRGARAAAAPGANLLLGVPAFEDAATSGNIARACGPIHINGFTWAALRNAALMAGWLPVAPPGALVLKGRHILYAVAGDPQQPEPGALDAVLEVLRQYGRQLDRAGEFVAAQVHPGS
jgi:SAM-dependent methyltransferase